MLSRDPVDIVSCPYCASNAKSFKWNLFDDAHLAWSENVKVFRCKSCNLVYSHIKNIDAAYYNDKYYVFQKHRESADRAFAKHCIEWIISYTAIFGKRILDVGCGNGYFCEEAKKMGSIVVGLEPSIQTGLDVENRVGIKVVKGFFEDTEIDEEPFDIITMWDVFEHSPFPLIMLKKVRSLLNENGVLALSVPNFSSLFSFVAGPFWKGFNNYHISHFTKDKIKEVLENNGFNIIRIETFDNTIFSREGIFRIGIKDRFKALSTKIPFVRRTLLKRRGSIIQKTPLTGHNDYLFSGKKSLFSKLLEWPIKHFLLGDQIRILAKKI